MNKILKKIGEKINKFIKDKKKSPEEKNSSVGIAYFNGNKIGQVGSFQAKVEFEKSNQDEITKGSINKSYEFSDKIIISPRLKRICKRTLENKRLCNILRHTRKNRTKKKLAKRIKKNNKLNELDK